MGARWKVRIISGVQGLWTQSYWIIRIILMRMIGDAFVKGVYGRFIIHNIHSSSQMAYNQDQAPGITEALYTIYV